MYGCDSFFLKFLKIKELEDRVRFHAGRREILSKALRSKIRTVSRILILLISVPDVAKFKIGVDMSESIMVMKSKAMISVYDKMTNKNFLDPILI